MNTRVKLEKLKKGEITCSDNLKNFLNNVNENNKKFNILLDLNKDVEQRAIDLDKKRENNENLGRLYGLVFVLKSNISIKGLKISCASKTLENYKGSFNADVTQRILDEDGIILGIVNNDEFANGISGETSAFGYTINPNCISRVPGGSSSGSAAALAANFCDIALGSDTGGSIRNPASHCGVFGIKPSYGRVSRYGLVDLSMSLDQIGPLSHDSYGSALVMEIISGHSYNDPITKSIKVDNYTHHNNRELKIGVVQEFLDSSSKEIREIIELAIEKLKSRGHTIKKVEIDKIDLSIQSYYPIVYTEFFSGTRRFEGLKYGEKIEEVSGPEVLRRIFGGEQISQSEFEGAYYKRALRVKDILKSEFDRVFSEVDVIITPITPKPPHKFGEKISAEDAYYFDAFTCPANLAGICSVSVPGNNIVIDGNNIPIGVQLMANSFKEDVLFDAARIIESLNE